MSPSLTQPKELSSIQPSKNLSKIGIWQGVCLYRKHSSELSNSDDMTRDSQCFWMLQAVIKEAESAHHHWKRWVLSRKRSLYFRFRLTCYGNLQVNPPDHHTYSNSSWKLRNDTHRLRWYFDQSSQFWSVISQIHSTIRRTYLQNMDSEMKINKSRAPSQSNHLFCKRLRWQTITCLDSTYILFSSWACE